MNSGKKCKTERFSVFAQIFTTGNVEEQKKNPNFFMVIADIENRKGFFTALGVTHVACMYVDLISQYHPCSTHFLSMVFPNVAFTQIHNLIFTFEHF